MKQFLTSLVILLTVIVLSLFSADLSAYDQVLLFSDDFSDGSTENWFPELGEWTAENYEFCQLECGT